MQLFQLVQAIAIFAAGYFIHPQGTPVWFPLIMGWVSGFIVCGAACIMMIDYQNDR